MPTATCANNHCLDPFNVDKTTNVFFWIIINNNKNNIWKFHRNWPQCRQFKKYFKWFRLLSWSTRWNWYGWISECETLVLYKHGLCDAHRNSKSVKHISPHNSDTSKSKLFIWRLTQIDAIDSVFCALNMYRCCKVTIRIIQKYRKLLKDHSKTLFIHIWIN